MKSRNTNLHTAKSEKNDEFYTQLSDIEKELGHYKSHFKNKVVFCNCDDPEESNFWKYFHLNFKFLGLKKLISTHYVPQDLFTSGETYSMIYSGGNDNDITVGNKSVLERNGDFRSPEAIDLLKESDIVVTNPPFSLFREYVAQLIEYDKKFLILGNQNAITYKETFKLIKENLLWLGYDNGGIKWFQVPDDYDIITESRKKIENGVKYFSMGSIIWYTNLEHSRRNDEIILYKEYNERDYPKYDNYDAINVDKVKDIPKDFDGVMGVPITFLDKWNPKQFKILGMANSARWICYECLTIINGQNIYNRILIKKQMSKL